MLVHSHANWLSEVGSLLKEGKMKEALAVCARTDMSKSYLGHLLSAGLKEFESREDEYGIDAVERAIEKNAITETASLNKGLNILGDGWFYRAFRWAGGDYLRDYQCIWSNRGRRWCRPYDARSCDW